ncbi:uncharacterized protein [Amphiura filiformis]|uniref:uncharacterized protein n=1 Tax=Amphiura filiformis TaxID=82378 RepID=UPI003B20D515
MTDASKDLCAENAGAGHGKRDFGSFYSSNVEELINMPEDEYIPPEFPFTFPSYDVYKSSKTAPPLGRKMRRKHYFLEEDCTFLNHGAFGASLKEAVLVAQQWQAYIEKQPLRFFDREVLIHLIYITRRMAKFVGCHPGELALVPNVTSAMNAVIKNLDIKQGDNIYYLNVTYGSVKTLIKHTAKEKGATIQEETIEFPIQSKQQIINLVKNTLRKGTKLAVFDHIPSNTPFIQPLQELIHICHERGVPVLVDGAHGLGILPLNLHELDVDYYTTNCHKWFSSFKGCALLYVKKSLQSTVGPLIISHGFGHGFNSDFMWSGLRDYSPFLSLHTVLDFWQSVGVQRIRDYVYKLREQAAEYLVRRWNTGLIAPKDMFGSMAAVRLPSIFVDGKQTVSYSDAEVIQNNLYQRFNIEVPIKAVQGQLYVRISCHIHNELKDYENLAEAILVLAAERVQGVL